MQNDLDRAKKEFTRLVAEDFGSQKMLDFVIHIWENADLSPDDAGWVLWNICDQYALGRANDPITQHRYQSEFFELVKRSFPERAHWVVCDGTQANGQIRGGFLDFWWGCYQFANDNAPRVAENRGARFEAHRANAGSHMKFGELERAGSALEAMAALLEEDAEWPSLEFASVTYVSLLVEFYGATGQTGKVEETGENLERMLDDWLQRVGDAKIVGLEEKPLFGSWQAINADRPPAAVFVGVHDAACEFAKAGRFPAAERLFRILQDRGRTMTDYGEALFLLSCWRNGRSKDEIIRMLSRSKKISPEYLVHIAPEMADVVRNSPG